MTANPAFALDEHSSFLRTVVYLPTLPYMPIKKRVTRLEDSEDRRRPNALFHGDNLEILLRYIEDGTVDLVYLDPPFQSGKDYNLLFRKEDGSRPRAQTEVFADTWHWDAAAATAYEAVLAKGGRVAEVLESMRRLLENTPMLAYMSMMAIRLIELRRVLRPDGSLYLHCDPTASHYLKLVLDAVFGPEHFVNEIVWKRSSAHSGSKKYSPVHDTLLFYAKGDRHTWNQILQPLSQRTEDNWYNNIDKVSGRRFCRDNLTASGVRTGASGKPWRGSDPTSKGRHWAIPGLVRQEVPNLPQDTQEALDALDKMGRIHWPKKSSGMPRFKRYIDEATGVPALDVITDISPLNNVDAERLGYPTQKPLALLERIIEASSNEGDVVLDPFCGCGTTIQAAQKMRRKWIGIDVAQQAIAVIEDRLLKHFGDIVGASYELVREPGDLDGARALALQDRHQFEKWAVRLVGGDSDDKAKGADRGIDGVLQFQESPGAPIKKIIVSVKSGHVTVRDVRDLHGTITRENAAIGVLITLDQPTGPMKTEAASVGQYSTTHAHIPDRYPRVQILTVEELLDGGTIKAPITFRRRGPKRASPQIEIKFPTSARN